MSPATTMARRQFPSHPPVAAGGPQHFVQKRRNRKSGNTGGRRAIPIARPRYRLNHRVTAVAAGTNVAKLIPDAVDRAEGDEVVPGL